MGKEGRSLRVLTTAIDQANAANAANADNPTPTADRDVEADNMHEMYFDRGSLR